jgi:hypothetical protein
MLGAGVAGHTCRFALVNPSTERRARTTRGREASTHISAHLALLQRLPRLSGQRCRFSKLTANVEKVVTDLVQGVHGHPAKRPVEPLGIVVHDAPKPVLGR